MCTFFPYFKTFDIQQELETFGQMMTDQLDLRVEHDNLLEFEKNFRKIDQIQFPIPIKSSKHVLLESFMRGIHLKDILKLKCAPFNDEIVQLGLQAIVKMILKDNFLHTDLHPGNILVSFSKDDEQILPKFYQDFESVNSSERLNLLEKLKNSGFSTRLVILDAGLVTKLSENQYSSLLNITSAALESDAEKMTDIFISESKSPESVINRDLLTLKLNSLLHDINFQGSGALLFSELNSMKIVNSFVELVRDHRILLYGEYIGLLVSCLTVEGIGKSLDQNDFDIMPILVEACE